MILLQKVPKYDELDEYYGEAEYSSGIPNPTFVKDECEIVDLPFTMMLSWDPSKKIKQIAVNRRIVSAVLDALIEIGEYKGPEYLYKRKFNHFGGVYNYRTQRSGTRLTTHAWAASIDLNPHLAPYRVISVEAGEDYYVNNQPDFITKALLKRGFVTFPWDGMHYQAVIANSNFAKYHIDVIKKINQRVA